MQKHKSHKSSEFIEALGLSYFSVWIEFPGGAWLEKPIPCRTIADAQSRYRDMIPGLKSFNAKGSGIHVQPLGAIWPICVVDDVSYAGLQEMKKEGFSPAVVVLTSPGNYQAWVRWKPAGAATDPGNVLAVSRFLNERWGDTGAIGTNHRGRIAGFTTPKHVNEKGQHPYVRLIEASGATCEASERLCAMYEVRTFTQPKAGAPEAKIKASGAGPGAQLSAQYDYPAFAPEPASQAVLFAWSEAKKQNKREDPSRRDWHSVADLVSQGFENEQIAAAMRADTDVLNRKKKHVEDYIARTIWKSWGWVQDQKPVRIAR